MRAQSTRVVVRAVSCDAKIIGSLVGGCRISVRERDSGEVLAEGLQLGGSGDTESIMKTPRTRGATVFDTPGAACFEATLDLAEPTPVEIVAEGPLAYPDALQLAGKSTWLLPGRHLDGEGLVLTLHGFIVDVIIPASVDVLGSRQAVEIEAGVRLL